MKYLRKWKWQATYWQKIFANHVYNKGLLSRIYEKLSNSSSKKSNNSIKLSKICEQPFQQMAHEKMCNAIIHQLETLKKKNPKDKKTSDNEE